MDKVRDFELFFFSLILKQNFHQFTTIPFLLKETGITLTDQHNQKKKRNQKNCIFSP